MALFSKTTFQILLLGLLGLLIAFAFNVVLKLDVGKRVYNHRPGPCRHVDGIVHGSEDIELIASKDIAFVSSGVRMPGRAPEVRGEIFLYDFKQPAGQHKAEKLEIEGDLDRVKFGAHGLSHVIVDGKIRLFVTSHHGGADHSVEIFDFDEKRHVLKHVKTVMDKSFVSPNDISAVGPESFIISNDGGGGDTSPLRMAFEFFLGLKTGGLVYYDGEHSHTLATELGVSNGIFFNRKTRLLFDGLFGEETLGVYRVAKDFKSLEEIARVPLLSSPDNVFEDEKGTIWIGAHAVMKDALPHTQAPDDLNLVGPSQVLRVHFDEKYEKYNVSEVYADDGHQTSASSVAVYHKKQLLIGTVFRRLTHCDVLDENVIS